MKNIKYVAGVVVVLAGIVFSYFYFVVSPASANPDYICIKSVNRTCNITHVGEWKDGKKVSSGTRTTQRAYHHRRTDCEAGYTRKDGFTIGDSGDSGRFSPDFDYSTENCSITEYDGVLPKGKVEQVEE